MYLLSADGTAIQQGRVFRAGTTDFLPATLQPGTYDLVVDSSMGDWSRGEGFYRLNLGFNEELMGAFVPSPSSSLVGRVLMPALQSTVA